MAATLLAVIVALAIGHLAPDAASGVRQYGWFGGWLRWLNAQFPEGSIWRGAYGIALALVVPLLVVGLFQLALDQPLWGFVGLLFDIAVLFYCWGPRDLDLDVAAVLDAPDAASRRSAAERLWPEGEPAKLDGASLVEAVFRNALRRWFGVLFWFCLLGPFGAVLYRLTALAVESPVSVLLPPRNLAGARWLLAALTIVWAADSGAYFVGRQFGGKLFGNRKLAPRISPNKTIEGLVGGLLAGVLVGLHFISSPWQGIAHGL